MWHIVNMKILIMATEGYQNTVSIKLTPVILWYYSMQVPKMVILNLLNLQSMKPVQAAQLK